MSEKENIMSEHNHNEHCECHNIHLNSCSCCSEKQEDEEEMSLAQLVIAAILFVLGIVIFNLKGISFLEQKISIPHCSDFSLKKVLYFVLFLASYLVCGLPVLKNAVWNLFHGKVFDEQFLMAVASVGAIILGEYPEAVAVMLFYQIGEFFQDYALEKSEHSIKALMECRPDSATLIKDSKELAVSPDSVCIGDIILVRPGEKIPLDGIVIEGKSFVDTSALTGESVPREIFAGSEVLGGFVNNDSVLKIKVTKEFSKSSIAKIIDLVEHSSQKKSKAEKFISRFAKIYTPIVIGAACAVAVLPPIMQILSGALPQWNVWISRALIFLVVSCPCALVIYIPMGFMGGIAASAKNGILIKGSNYLI